MSFLAERELDEAFGPFAFFRQSLGFVPNLFRAQTLLPRVIEAEARIAGVVLEKEGALFRRQKECILLTVAAANANTYCAIAHREVLRSLGTSEGQLDQIAIDHHRAGLPDAHVALLDFALKLSQHPTWVGPEDIDALHRHGFTDEPILEAMLVTALAEFLCTLAVGLGALPDFDPQKVPSLAALPGPRSAAVPPANPPRVPAHWKPGSYLRAVDLSADTFAPFAFFRERFGFIPNIFRAQTLRPDVLEAEAHTVGTVLLTDDVLSRVRKEYILLVTSAANLNTYCVAVHCEMLRALGVPEDVSDRIAVDHHVAGLSAADTALLDFALKLSQRPREFGREDIETLRRHGFAEEQILESIVMTALTGFLNTLQMGLGTVPDFEQRRVFPLEGWSALHDLEPSAPAGREDPDASLVARVRAGDLGAFEELVRRYQRRIYRTLVGVTGNTEDAADALQNAFLRAFRNIGKFRSASKFSTWLTRIAINEGLRIVGGRGTLEKASDTGREDEEEFRPRELQAWDDNPEQLYSRQETRALVQEALLTLPAHYRVAVMLRDIEQLATAEAAAVLGLRIAAFKSRLLRGRLLVREALALHFTKSGGSSKDV